MSKRGEGNGPKDPRSGTEIFLTKLQGYPEHRGRNDG